MAIPSLLYGTAWKEEATEACVTAALEAGFRGIDTANQRKHYFEEAVGTAVQAAIRAGQVKREELFLQKRKFSSVVPASTGHGMRIGGMRNRLVL
jgi:diketogulonate reductase-like aldo/keto reductase